MSLPPPPPAWKFLDETQRQRRHGGGPPWGGEGWRSRPQPTRESAEHHSPQAAADRAPVRRAPGPQPSAPHFLPFSLLCPARGVTAGLEPSIGVHVSSDSDLKQGLTCSCLSFPTRPPGRGAGEPQPGQLPPEGRAGLLQWSKEQLWKKPTTGPDP